MTFSDVVKSNLEMDIGLPLCKIEAMSADEQMQYVRSQIGKPLTFSYIANDFDVPRGNPSLGQGLFMDIEEVDVFMDGIIESYKKKRRLQK